MEKHLYKPDNGNLVMKVAKNEDEEESHRSAGFLEIHELYPDPSAGNDLPSAEDLDAVADDEKAADATKPKQRKPRQPRKAKVEKSEPDNIQPAATE